MFFWLVFVFVYETAAASAAFFGAANAYGVLFANVSVFVVAAIAYVTVDLLVKFVVHSSLLTLPVIMGSVAVLAVSRPADTTWAIQEYYARVAKKHTKTFLGKCYGYD